MALSATRTRYSGLFSAAVLAYEHPRITEVVTVKGVACIINILTSIGMATGKELLLYLPLGPDSLQAICAKCEATLKICDE